MSNIKPTDNSANMTNRNKGTSGTNKQYDQAMATVESKFNKTEVKNNE